MRVTFYSTRGIQLGNTIDVWSDHFYKSSKTFVEAKESLKFTLYKTKTNFTYGYPTRIDEVWRKTTYTAKTCSEYNYGEWVDSKPVTTGCNSVLCNLETEKIYVKVS
jgi:predicted nucleic-acid-binding Zn-ribbon protein